METTHILVVDDEADVRHVVRLNLEREGWQVTTASDGRAALELLQQKRFDLAVLDVMMPGMDGLELCRNIRSDPVHKGLPVLLLTARDSEMDQIIGLEVGADDFVSKSASPRLITTRVKTLLRRRTATPEPGAVLRFGSLTIDTARREVLDASGLVELTHKEYLLLALFAEYPTRVFSRQDLLDRIWDDDVVVTERTVDVHIKNLRRKIGADGELIETVRGTGYRVRR